MYCQECGKEAQSGEVLCSACGGALTDAELDLPEIGTFDLDATPAPAAVAPAPGPPPIPSGTLAAPSAAASAAIMGPRIEVSVGGLAGSVAIAKEITTIGRADAATGQRPDIDLSMDVAVSRRHAEIRRSAGRLSLVDVGSTNGTVINGRPAPRQQEVALADGDEIRVGENCKLTVRL